METKITDHRQIAQLLATDSKLNLTDAECDTDDGFVAIVRAMKKSFFNNADLANLNIDLASLEALAREHGCYSMLFPKQKAYVVEANLASKKTAGQLLDMFDGIPDNFYARQQMSQSQTSGSLFDSEAYP